MPIGLYIHVPFCIRKCLYCDFASVPLAQDVVELYLRGLYQEIDHYSQTLPAEQKQIASLFVGGGTPTCLKAKQLNGILEQVSQKFFLVPQAEITTEANPGTVTLSYLQELRAVGFNRISLGVQSTHPKLLQLIGRIHSFEQAKVAVQDARQAGFDNLNLDLIFGLPEQTLEQWQQSLEEILTLSPEHISCYGLQLEEGTPLTSAVEKGELVACSEELELAMYQGAIATLKKAGYQHYEISNFARPGFQCQHNIIYWHNQGYLGVGPAAHSYLNHSRWGNLENITEYSASLRGGKLPVEEVHNLTVKEQMEETVFLGLRLLDGLSLSNFEERFGKPLSQIFGPQIEGLQKKGLVKIQAGHLKLTEQGLPLANQVFAEFV